MKGKIGVFLFAIPIVASAEIYKCVVDGVTLFSEHPCGDQAQIVKLKVDRLPEPSEQYSPDIGIGQTNVDDYVANRIAERKHKREIAQLERRKRRLEADRKDLSGKAKNSWGVSHDYTLALRQRYTNQRIDLDRELDKLEKAIEQENQRWENHLRGIGGGRISGR